MKQLHFLLIFFFLLPGLIILSTSCGKDKDPDCIYDDQGAGSSMMPDYLANCTNINQAAPGSAVGGATFNNAAFRQALLDSMPTVGGVQYAVMQNGVLFLAGRSGMARETGECPELTMTNCNRMNIASVSKLLTAATVIRMLYEQGLNETAAIGPYLPASWNVPTAMANLTFEQMLRHRSGLHEFTTNTNFSQTLSFESLKTLAENGPNPDSIGFTRYRNANYALMRIIIPLLWKGLPSCPPVLASAGEITDQISQNFYDLAVRNLILNPAGSGGQLDPSSIGDWETLNYAMDGAGGGIREGSWLAISGGGGWFMTATELVSALNGMVNGTTLTADMLNAMTSKNLGFWNNLAVKDGSLIGHGGDVTRNGREFHSILVYNQTSGIIIAINVNVRTAAVNGDLYNMVINAYNQAM